MRNVGYGKNPAGHVGLQMTKALTIVCNRQKCHGWVDYRCAMTYARAALEAGDGCAGPSCTTNYRRAQYFRVQKRRRGEVEAGKRMLVRRPEGLKPEYVALIRRGELEEKTAKHERWIGKLENTPNKPNARPPARRQPKPRTVGTNERRDEGSTS